MKKMRYVYIKVNGPLSEVVGLPVGACSLLRCDWPVCVSGAWLSDR